MIEQSARRTQAPQPVFFRAHLLRITVVLLPSPLSPKRSICLLPRNVLLPLCHFPLRRRHGYSGGCLTASLIAGISGGATLKSRTPASRSMGTVFG